MFVVEDSGVFKVNRERREVQRAPEVPEDENIRVELPVDQVTAASTAGTQGSGGAKQYKHGQQCRATMDSQDVTLSQQGFLKCSTWPFLKDSRF